MRGFQTEPVAVVNAIRLVALAAMAFGLHLSEVQLVATMTALESVLTLFTRSQVTNQVHAPIGEGAR